MTLPCPQNTIYTTGLANIHFRKWKINSKGRVQRQNINEEMQKAKEEGQVPRQEDMEKVHGNMRKMPNRYSNINCMWYREPLKWGTRDITRLDIMAYLDPASNPGSIQSADFCHKGWDDCALLGQSSKGHSDFNSFSIMFYVLHY